MERYGCLVISVIIALLILGYTVYLWSGWLNRPVGRAPAAAAASLNPATDIPAPAGIHRLPGNGSVSLPAVWPAPRLRQR